MNASDQQDHSSRVEREIREILERADTAPTPVENFQAVLRRQTATLRSRFDKPVTRDRGTRYVSPDTIRIGGSLLLAIAAAGLANLSQFAAMVLAIAGALVFFSLWFPARPSRPGGPSRWRGQDLGDSGPVPPFSRNRDRPR